MMATKGGKSSACGRGAAQSRLNIAREYQDLAHSRLDTETGAVRNAVTGNAILIGSKPTSHYGDTFIGKETLKSCLRAMDQLVLAAMRAVTD